MRATRPRPVCTARVYCAPRNNTKFSRQVNSFPLVGLYCPLPLGENLRYTKTKTNSPAWALRGMRQRTCRYRRFISGDSRVVNRHAAMLPSVTYMAWKFQTLNRFMQQWQMHSACMHAGTALYQIAYIRNHEPRVARYVDKRQPITRGCRMQLRYARPETQNAARSHSLYWSTFFVIACNYTAQKHRPVMPFR